MKNLNKNKKSSKTHHIVSSEENYISQREVAMNFTRVPLLVILVVVLAQHANIIILSAGSSDGGHYGTG
jgi:hypothetical protein